MQQAKSAALARAIGLPLREMVVAPMVDASELPFRMLCRKYGATLCYTPMLHSRLFAQIPEYRAKKFRTCPEDRPLFAQFCGHDKDLLLEAARHVEGQCDAVDLNLGCPQGIAKRGRYGAFLLEEWDLLSSIVSHLSANLKVPVTCKIRLLPCVDRTIQLAKLLEASGCSLLTVHGRVKEAKGRDVGVCDWDAIRRIKEALSIPVIANGGVGTFAEALRCREATGADAVMSSEALLENPALVAGMENMPSPFQIAYDYLDMVEKYPDATKIVRGHIFKLLHGPLSVHGAERATIAKQLTEPSLDEYLEHLRAGIKKMEALHLDGGCTLEVCKAQPAGTYYPWYDRHRKAVSKYYTECTTTGHIIPDGAAPDSREDILRLREERKIRKKMHKEAARKREEANRIAALKGETRKAAVKSKSQKRFERREASRQQQKKQQQQEEEKEEEKQQPSPAAKRKPEEAGLNDASNKRAAVADAPCS